MSLDRGDGFRLDSDCDSALSQEIAMLTRAGELWPIPLKRLVQFQLHVGLKTMARLANKGSKTGVQR